MTKAQIVSDLVSKIWYNIRLLSVKNVFISINSESDIVELKTIDGRFCLMSSNIHATFNNISVISSSNEQFPSYIMTRTSCIQ